MKKEQPAQWKPNLSPRQMQVFDVGETPNDDYPNWPTVCLVSGAVRDAKSLASAHRIIRHLWETSGARVGIIYKTGNREPPAEWNELLRLIDEEWKDGVGIEFSPAGENSTLGPITDPVSGIRYFRVFNKYKNSPIPDTIADMLIKSECRAIPVAEHEDMALKLKGTRFSAIWLLGFNFDPKSLLIPLMQLRMFHLKSCQHLLIADLHPAICLDI